MTFQALEAAPVGATADLDSVLGSIPWNADGLIPAIAQQSDTREVLMLAWMNRDALRETLTTGRVCYWSRSRQSFWRKGETSGNQQHLVSAFLDCDGDTLLLEVNQSGPACHTLRRSCFYLALSEDGARVVTSPET